MRVVAGSRGYVSRRPEKTRVRVSLLRMPAQDNSDRAVAYPRLPATPRRTEAAAMSGQPQARVLLATLTECESARGNVYLRGWAVPPTWSPSAARTTTRAGPRGSCSWSSASRAGGQAPARRPQEREATSARASAPASAGTRPASSYHAPHGERAKRLGRSGWRRRRPSATACTAMPTSTTRCLSDAPPPPPSCRSRAHD